MGKRRGQNRNKMKSPLTPLFQRGEYSPFNKGGLRGIFEIFAFVLELLKKTHFVFVEKTHIVHAVFLHGETLHTDAESVALPDIGIETAV